ncbi:hypothetical protein Arub01_37120 [Actinomadura rubrobrunea]|uniref:Histidine kinase/HSP90-like ATPase domain-containing protein n=1 Tax=Actinomadura rubrobrunea TaxID=115335 RepID=A0A9W6PZ06_9ACTN|nr:ATP-binding protein [Actinomadura rubrobrunea]GLW65468.1 hypothetical protein Arub01_37120 [Actinomadura rubrobrunea]
MHTSSELIHDAAPPGAAPVGGPDVRSGWAWTLPRGPECARRARTLLADALAALAVPPDAIADARVMVSELATNAYQHAADHGPHELWLSADEGGARPPAEVRCAVFDAFGDATLPGYSWTSGDCGRGLSIVAELSRGRWGLLRTFSRLDTPVPGKAVWFAVAGAS